jgi:hypothetical protein
LPIKNNCLKIPLKSFLIPLTKPFALNVEMWHWEEFYNSRPSLR